MQCNATELPYNASLVLANTAYLQQDQQKKIQPWSKGNSSFVMYIKAVGGR